MLDLPKGFVFYRPDTAPLSATDPPPFPNGARKRPPPWRVIGWLRRAAVGPGEYPPFQPAFLMAERGEVRERDDGAEGFIVWSRPG